MYKGYSKFFQTFFKNSLFSIKHTISNFLDSLDLPSTGSEQNKILTAELTQDELDKAINSLKTNKSPGTDGYPSEWYKIFCSELTLLRSFNHTLKEGELLQSWKEAIISVIHKQGKDSKESSSYRPISVLNVDYKLYTSILAKRLETILPDLIDHDQSSFIRNRQIHDNIRRTLQIMSHITKNKISAVFLSLEAEKAFDSVSWLYLHQVLHRFGFKEKMY